MTDEIIQNLAQILEAINTNMPVLVLTATPAQKATLLADQQAASDNFEAAQALAFEAGDAGVQQAAQQLQSAQAAADASLKDLTNISTVLNALANAVTAGAQIVALGTSII